MKDLKNKVVVVLFISLFLFPIFDVHSALLLRGTDTHGNRLIYDNDLNITWYDYTNSLNTWQNQMDWAGALSVTFGSNVYTDWRLPTAVDGIWVLGYDGTTTGGFNITSSEMGHLFYTELGNKGQYDVYAQLTGCGNNCLANTGDFQHLQSGFYWASTEYSADPNTAWHFKTTNGGLNHPNKSVSEYAIAVHPGDVTTSPVPLPGSLLLLGSGLTALTGARLRKKRT